MKKPTRVLSLAFVLGMLVAAPAAASSGTQVKITSWKVHTGVKVRKVKPGATVKVCASQPVSELSARGKVGGATKGKAYSAEWTRNGKKFATFPETWRKGGSFRTTFGIGGEGFQPAKYGLKLVEGSKTIGTSAITLKVKKGC
jgi:hypothetical protein